MSTQQVRNRPSGSTMLAARIHEYEKPLVVENAQKPESITGESVLVRIGAAGLCHSDLHLINGQWKEAIPLRLPKIPGHEIAGWVEAIGDSVPDGLLAEGEPVAVFGGWGCGICLYCKRGDEQLCTTPRWPGLSESEGGFAEYIRVPSYRFLVKAGRNKLTPEEMAPLTDAGLTPYRAVKKASAMLGPGKSIAIIGMGGLGLYGIQYAHLLASNSTIIAIDRNDSKLELAEELGSEYVVNSRTTKSIRDDVLSITEGRGVDVIVDTVGAENTISDAFKIMAKSGALVVVGLFGSQVKIPLLQAVVNEQRVYASLWGNYNELREVIDLAGKRKIRHTSQTFPLNDINRAIEELRKGKILGRAIIVP